MTETAQAQDTRDCSTEWELRRGDLQIERALGVSCGTVSRTVSHAEAAEPTWDDVQGRGVR